MRPPGRQTRRISCATLMGSGTTLIKYGAYTMSNESSRNLRVGGVHLQQPHAARPCPCIAVRSRAFSSMEEEEVDAGDGAILWIQG